MAWKIIRSSLVLAVLLLAAYGLFRLLKAEPPRSREPFYERTETDIVALPHVTRGDILSQFKMITVERQYKIPVRGTTYKPMPSPEKDGAWGNLSQGIFGKRERVPGTTQNLVYEMVTTATVGMDLSKLQDVDIQNADRVTTITLPEPEVIAIVHDAAASRIYRQDRPTLPFVGNPANLLQQMQVKGEQRHRREAEEDEALMAQARATAQANLKRLLTSIHPGRDIVFNYRSPQVK